MAFTAKSLADGQLAAAQGDLYTVPAATKAMIATMEFYNNGANTETVAIFQQRSGGTSRQIERFVPVVRTRKQMNVMRVDCISSSPLNLEDTEDRVRDEQKLGLVLEVALRKEVHMAAKHARHLYAHRH